MVSFPNFKKWHAHSFIKYFIFLRLWLLEWQHTAKTFHQVEINRQTTCRFSLAPVHTSVHYTCSLYGEEGAYECWHPNNHSCSNSKWDASLHYSKIPFPIGALKSSLLVIHTFFPGNSFPCTGDVTGAQRNTSFRLIEVQFNVFFLSFKH